MDDIKGKTNHNTALQWEYDTRRAWRWNRDPKPVFGISSYSVFRSNPILNNDILGDTTIAFTTQGVYIGTIHDGLKNQVHYFNYSTDKGEQLVERLNSIKKDGGNIDGIVGQVRNFSVAYMGENSSMDLKDVADLSLKDKTTEYVFIPTTSETREIRFKPLANPPGKGTSSETSPEEVLTYNNIGGGERALIFGLGHTHIHGFAEYMKNMGAQNTMLRLGTPTNSTQVERSAGRYNERHDYKNHLGMKAVNLPGGVTVWKDRITPLFISSPLGVTIYNNDTRRGRETIVNYTWFNR